MSSVAEFQNLPNAYSITIFYHCTLSIYKYACSNCTLYFYLFLLKKPVLDVKSPLKPTKFLGRFWRLKEKNQSSAWAPNKGRWAQQYQSFSLSSIRSMVYFYRVFLASPLDLEEEYFPWWGVGETGLFESRSTQGELTGERVLCCTSAWQVLSSDSLVSGHTSPTGNPHTELQRVCGNERLLFIGNGTVYASCLQLQLSKYTMKLYPLCSVVKPPGFFPRNYTRFSWFLYLTSTTKAPINYSEGF